MKWPKTRAVPAVSHLTCSPPPSQLDLGFLGDDIHHLQLEQDFAIFFFWHMDCLFVLQVLSSASFPLARQ